MLNVPFQTFKIMLGCEVMVVTRSISDVSDNVRMSGHGCLSYLPAVCLLCSKGIGQGCIFMQYCTLLHDLPMWNWW